MEATTTKERPIIMQGHSVRAILDGKKRMTRRVVKDENLPTVYVGDTGRQRVPQWYWEQCPYGRVGDRLWCREAWRTYERPSDCIDGILYEADDTFHAIEDTRAAADRWVEAHHNGKYANLWRSPMFMPRWASRLTLEITGVRVERLQDITEADARAEGYERPVIGCALDGFSAAWDRLNASRGFPWSSNPFVWVVSFTPEVSQ